MICYLGQSLFLGTNIIHYQDQIICCLEPLNTCCQALYFLLGTKLCVIIISIKCCMDQHLVWLGTILISVMTSITCYNQHFIQVGTTLLNMMTSFGRWDQAVCKERAADICVPGGFYMDLPHYTRHTDTYPYNYELYRC